MSALANQLPVVIIAEMLGVPSEHRERFRRWSDAVTSNGMTGKPAEPAVREAVAQLREYLALAIERHRRERGDDLISALVAAHDDAEALSGDELLAFVVLLLVAGERDDHQPHRQRPAGAGAQSSRVPTVAARSRANPIGGRGDAAL